MERSFAAPAPASRPRSGSGRARARGGEGIAGLRVLRGGVSRLLAFLAAHRRLRIALICGVLALPLLGGAFLLLRRSPLVAVEHVRITGLHGPQAHAIELALGEAARGMSTLDVNTAALHRAVAAYPQVGALTVSAGFPHTLRVAVDEQAPVAVLAAAGTRTAVAADGVVLGAGLAGQSLPSIAEAATPGAGARVRNPLVLEALRVLGAAPSAFDRLAARAYVSTRGLTVAMRNGLLVYFGDAERPHAKWLALARVLADPDSAGAGYVDVRVPEKPAAGFGEAAARISAEASSVQPRGRETTISALAAGLSANAPKGPAAAGQGSSAASGEATSSGEAGGAESSEGGGEQSSAEGSEAAAEPGG